VTRSTKKKCSRFIILRKALIWGQKDQFVFVQTDLVETERSVWVDWTETKREISLASETSEKEGEEVCGLGPHIG